MVMRYLIFYACKSPFLWLSSSFFLSLIRGVFLPVFCCQLGCVLQADISHKIHHLYEPITLFTSFVIIFPACDWFPSLWGPHPLVQNTQWYSYITIHIRRLYWSEPFCGFATHRTMCPEGDFLVKIKFIQIYTTDQSLVDPIYVEFDEESNKIHFKALK